MFSKIMIPVDLGHTDKLNKAISIAASLAKMDDAKVTVVGVTLSGPTAIAPNPEKFAEKLGAFAVECSDKYGVTFTAHSEVSHDPTIDLDGTLMGAANSIGADLVVMASHVPGFAEYIFASNAGYLASHSKMSVFVVR
ncbi:MAG: universal stress protein [Pseudomonadota bacterium]